MTKLKKVSLIVGILAVVAGLIGLFTIRRLIVAASPRPANLGVSSEGQLMPCPESPNCVSSQTADTAHYIEPIPYQSSGPEARERLLTVLADLPRTEVVTDQSNYIHAETQTPILNFIDDSEFYFDDTAQLIHIRGASRLGQDDLGVNRRRIEDIRAAFMNSTP